MKTFFVFLCWFAGFHFIRGILFIMNIWVPHDDLSVLLLSRLYSPALLAFDTAIIIVASAIFFTRGAAPQDSRIAKIWEHIKRYY